MKLDIELLMSEKLLFFLNKFQGIRPWLSESLILEIRNNTKNAEYGNLMIR